MKIIKINPETPPQQRILEVVDVLRKGGIIIYPTDSVYAMGCDLFNQKAIQRLCQLKQVKPDKANFSFICYDLSDISNYVKQLHNNHFKLMKKVLPGPFTFILNATNQVPKMVQTNRKTVGIRVPDNNIPRQLVRELGNPIITTSIKDQDEIVEYSTDPELIYDDFKHQVDIVIDGGYGNNVATTILDCTNDDIQIIREGLGDITPFI